ncbi:MAG TPA: hypothetical protein VFI31_05815 [Pirellulales bacterium]|nr:hypothetical protein [Pirellulales bacterium]
MSIFVPPEPDTEDGLPSPSSQSLDGPGGPSSGEPTAPTFSGPAFDATQDPVHVAAVAADQAAYDASVSAADVDSPPAARSALAESILWDTSTGFPLRVFTGIVNR